MFAAILTWTARLALLGVCITLIIATTTDILAQMRWVIYQHADKVGHFTSIFLLSSVSLMAFPTISAWRLFIAAAVVAALVEIVQLFNAREADLLDFIISVAGIGVVAIIYAHARERGRLAKESPDYDSD